MIIPMLIVIHFLVLAIRVLLGMMIYSFTMDVILNHFMLLLEDINAASGNFDVSIDCFLCLWKICKYDSK